MGSEKQGMMGSGHGRDPRDPGRGRDGGGEELGNGWRHAPLHPLRAPMNLDLDAERGMHERAAVMSRQVERLVRTDRDEASFEQAGLHGVRVLDEQVDVRRRA